MIAVEKLAGVRKVVTHANCADGVASACILHHALGPDVPIEFVQYNTPEHRDLVAEPGLLFCDFTPPAERAREFLEAGALVLDHHRYAKAMMFDFEAMGQGVYADETADPGVGGAMLAYEHVWLPRFPDAAPREVLLLKEFATLAGIRDTWQRSSPRWLAACEQAEALRLLGEDALGYGLFVVPGRIGGLMTMGGVLLKRAQANIKRAVASAVPYTFAGGTKALLLDTLAVSDALDVAPGIRLVAGFRYGFEDDRVVLHVSLRCREPLDVGRIATALGGGGHTRAAGFTLRGDGVDVDNASPHNLIIGALQLHLREGDQP